MALNMIGKSITDDDEELFFHKLVDRLIEIRMMLKLTQSNFVYQAGLNPGSYSHIESKDQRPSLRIIKTLCIYYGISIDYLFFGTGNKFIYNDDSKIKREIDTYCYIKELNQ